jgi:aryl-alcohol dehydrogenase-like predicted oxidoreductase
VVVATKGGFLPFDGAPPGDPRSYFEETFVRSGLARIEEIVAGCHCLAPRYLQAQIEQSLANLDLATVDIYCLHNPETQLEEVPRPEFRRRMRAAFELLEENVARGRIRVFGTATWNGFRVAPDSREHLSLADLSRLAEEVGGPGHHYRVIQLPFSLAMPEAWLGATQDLAGKRLSLLDAASRLGIAVLTAWRPTPRAGCS